MNEQILLADYYLEPNSLMIKAANG